MLKRKRRWADDGVVTEDKTKGASMRVGKNRGGKHRGGGC